MLKQLFKISIILAGLIFISGCTRSLIETRPHTSTNFGIAESFAMKGITKMRVAVLPFRNYARSGNIGTHISDEFSIQVLKTGRFDVVERNQIEKIVNEQKLKDDKDYQSFGKILGVEGLFVGSVIKYDPSLRNPVCGLAVRLVDVETGNNLWACEEIFYGQDAEIQALVPSQDAWKVTTDIDYLTRLLCESIAQTLNY
ncbi:MAG: CsgG/HfaB family protein [Candidatus Hydrogenedentota bacterium]